MKNLFYIHFNEQELLDRIEPLKEAGYKVGYHFTAGKAAQFGDPLPDVLILSLDRVPSHAKAYAQWFREAKKREHIPIVFVGGQPEKTGTFKELFPKAHFCESRHLLSTLKKLS
jgi:hypothetical protein